MGKSIKVQINVEIELKKGVLTKEVMDNYERYFHDISNDSDFEEFETQEEKHIANISQYIARGHTDFIEGYGSMSKILEKDNIELYSISKY